MVKELINSGSSTVRSFEAILVLVISLMMISTNMGRASAAAAADVSNGGFMIINGDDHWSNAITTGTGGRSEEMEMEEFLMDSEANRRLLLASRSGSISYNSLPKGPICNAQRYGSCIGNVLNKGRRNQCTLANRCKH